MPRRSQAIDDANSCEAQKLASYFVGIADVGGCDPINLSNI